MLLLSTAYLPPIQYFQKIVSAEVVCIEKYEHYIKQTYRNRCYILSANGVQCLSIPLIQTHEKIIITSVKISYAENWQKRHWRSITSAYGNSPFFIYYADELKVFYEKKFDLLFEYNLELLQVLLRLLKIKAGMRFTES